MITSYELYFKTPMSLTDLLDKFAKMGYPGKAKLTKDGLHLMWMDGNGGTLSAMLSSKGTWGGMNKYELEVESKDDFMKLHDILMSMGLCINKYEIHYKTDNDIMDIKNAIESMGYRTVIDLTTDGVEWHIMNNGNGYMNVKMEVYKEDEKDGKEYEFCVNNRNDFMKLYDILYKMM